MKTNNAPLLAVVLVLALAACDTNVTFNSEGFDWTDRVDLSDFEYSAWEPFQFDLPLAGLGGLEVLASTGSTSITGRTDLASARVAGRKGVYAHTARDAGTYLNELHVLVESEAPWLRVRSSHPGQIGPRAFRVEYEIEIPNDWLIEVEQLNGNVAISRVTAGVSVRLTNGEIDYAGVVGAGDFVHLAATNADVTLRLADATSADLTATVTNGSVFEHGLSLSNRNATSRTLEGRLGSGDGTVEVAVVNGLIHLSGDN